MIMREFDCITVDYFKHEELLLWKIKDTGMPNFCLKGLQEFKEFSEWVQDFFSHPNRPLKFIVSASEHKGVYNMGGDLPFFLNNIKNKNISKLQEYAHLCIDAMYIMYTSFNLPVITVALLEGNAYGGGFEFALAHDFMIATEGVKLGLPENKFNLFPGMGAYSLLFRKLNTVDADRIIRSGKVFNARYFESLGLINTIAEKESAMVGLHSLAKKLNERFNFEYYHSICKKKVFPLKKEELIEITDVWVDACMKISNLDLRRMEILAKAQFRKSKVLIN